MNKKKLTLQGLKGQLEHSKFLSKSKKLKLNKDIQLLENELNDLSNKLKYEFMMRLLHRAKQIILITCQRYKNASFLCPYSTIDSWAYIFLNESNFNSTEMKSYIRAHFSLHENFEIWEI